MKILPVKRPKSGLPKKPKNLPCVCKLCGMVLPSKWKLGGHVSNVHPGLSSDYKQKRDRYLARTSDRLILL